MGILRRSRDFGVKDPILPSTGPFPVRGNFATEFRWCGGDTPGSGQLCNNMEENVLLTTPSAA